MPKSIGFTILLLSTCLLMSLGCKSHSPEKQQQVMTLLHFQKTACYGPCPAYEATISTDGHVTFAGFDHVPSTDTLYFKLSPATLDSLQLALKSLDYNTLQEVYPTQWTDMPATITTFYQEGKKVKSIRHLQGGPDKLEQFQEWLDQQLLGLAEAAAKENNPIK